MDEVVADARADDAGRADSGGTADEEGEKSGESGADERTNGRQNWKNEGAIGKEEEKEERFFLEIILFSRRTAWNV